MSDTAPGPEISLAERHTELTEWLRSSRASTDPEWLEAFAVVPRHVFVPEFLRTTMVEGRLHTETIAHPSAQWHEAVYTDTALPTHRDVTSSSSAPSVMARMLDALDIPASDENRTLRVLEVGTGTGYNTGLLCARLGAENVHSVDIDAECVEHARQRLYALGYAPDLSASDGAIGRASHEPYDRVLATCRVETVPPAWLAQLRADGVIVAPMSTGVIQLHRQGENPTVSGRFLPDSAYFMPLRPAAGQADVRAVARLAAGAPRSRSGAGTDRSFPYRANGGEQSEAGMLMTEAENAALRLIATGDGDASARFWVELLVPGFFRGSTEDEATLVYHRDGSWARINPDATIHQGGPRRLWTLIADAYLFWERLGEPAREQVGLTIAPSGQQLWLEEPDHIIEEWVHPTSE